MLFPVISICRLLSYFSWAPIFCLEITVMTAYGKSQQLLRQQNYARAFDTLNSVVDLNLPIHDPDLSGSRYAISHLYYHGFGTLEDKDKANKYLTLAAEGGNDKAIKQLNMLKNTDTEAKQTANLNNINIPPQLKREWEHRFPDLGNDWTHWKIHGDGATLEVVSGANLQRAIQVIEERFGQFSSIKVNRATVNEADNIEHEDKSLFEISRFEHDKSQLDTDDEYKPNKSSNLTGEKDAPPS